MHRFFLPPDRCSGEVFDLGDSDAHHAASVLRLQPREEVVVLNGAGLRIHAWVDSVQKRRVTLRRFSQESIPQTPHPITLIQAVAKPKAMDWILQKATELGVSTLLPIVTDHCVSRPNAAEAESKRAGWETTVIEAAKQSNAAWIPRVSPPCSFKEFIAQQPPVDIGLVASLHAGARPIDEALDQFSRENGRPPASAAIVIGPEGDLSNTELQQLLISGYQPFTLGDLVLRCETAALAALTLIQHELRRRQTRAS